MFGPVIETIDSRLRLKPALEKFVLTGEDGPRLYDELLRVGHSADLAADNNIRYLANAIFDVTHGADPTPHINILFHRLVTVDDTMPRWRLLDATDGIEIPPEHFDRRDAALACIAACAYDAARDILTPVREKP
jgi:hypothetical protein